MKKHIHSIISVTLGVLTIILISKSITIARDVTMMREQAAAKQQEQPQAAPATALPAYELITVKQTIEGLVKFYHLPLNVDLQKTSLKIAPPPAETTGKNTDQRDLTVLNDFDAIKGFFSALSTISYRLDVKELCVGKDCPLGFSMTAEVNHI